MPTEALGLLYLLKNCHTRGTAPLCCVCTVQSLHTCCFDVNCELVDEFHPTWRAFFTASKTSFCQLAIDHGPLVPGRAFARIEPSLLFADDHIFQHIFQNFATS